MARKKVYNLYNKIRQALRDIYRYSPMRREAIKAITLMATPSYHYPHFMCPICKKYYPIQMADVDHEPPLGALEGFIGPEFKATDLGPWAHRLFYGPVQVLCKLCHKAKTARQRRKK